MYGRIRTAEVCPQDSLEVAINDAMHVIIYGKEASRWCLHCTTLERNEVIGQPARDPGHSHGSLEDPAWRVPIEHLMTTIEDRNIITRAVDQGHVWIL